MVISNSTTAALELAESGLEVFPLRPNNKEPFPHFKWRNKASKLPHIVETLWSGRETANVAACIPEDVIVLDCDSHETREHLEMVQDLGGTVEIKTPNGYHFWYRWPRDQGASRNTTDLFRVKTGPLSKVDTRGLGGYCVMPPSVVRNRPYRWVVSDPEHWQVDIVRAPEWLVDAMTSIPSGPSAGWSDPESGSYFKEPLSSGSRNEDLFKLGCKLRAQGMPEVSLKATLLLENQQQCKPPLPVYEVVKIFHSCLKYEPTGNKYSTLHPRRDRGLFKRASEIESKKVDWLLEPYIGLGRTTLYAGPGGLGKSRSSTALAAHVSSGTTIPNVGRVKQGPVIIFSAEDEPETVLKPLLEEQGADLDQVYIFELPEEGFVLDSDSLARMAEGIAEIKPVLVIIDPIMSFLDRDTDAHAGNDVNSVMVPLTALADDYHLSMLVIHHVNASGGVYGSVYFRNSVRSVLKLYPDPLDPDYFYIAHHKANHARKAGSIRFSFEDDCVKWDGVYDEWTDQKLSSFKYDPESEENIMLLMEQIEHEMGVKASIPLWQVEQIGKAMFAHRDWVRIALARLEMEMRVDPDGQRYYQRTR